MVLQLSRELARHLLAGYHFRVTDLAGVFTRLGTVQYDPLNPVGRNVDLVFQARVPGYRVDDWLSFAYEQRQVYDAWDKQACLVPVSDWPLRALTRERFRSYHDHEILHKEVEAVAALLAALDERGPLSSLDFERKTAGYDPRSWAGATQAKRILRALWTRGELVIHHRRHGRHYYDRAERVIPARHFSRPALLDETAYFRWLLARRYQAVGLLRPSAEAAVWSACGTAAQRTRVLADLVEEGTLVPVHVGPERWLYYAHASALSALDRSLEDERVIFLGPLDSLLWDRKEVRQIFGFDYTWEVYKPPSLRKWGYYVLPIFWRDRFIARVDARLEQGILKIARWWWEEDIVPDIALLDALRAAFERFFVYLGTDRVQVSEGVDAAVRQVVRSLTAL